MPVQVEGLYTKALLDPGAQVTLLFRDFNDKHLKHPLLQELKDLKIWGIGAEKFLYEGYLPVNLAFYTSVVRDI